MRPQPSPAVPAQPSGTSPRRSEPITLLAKRGHLHLQTQKLALVVITQEAEAHSLVAQSYSTVQSHSLSSHALGTVARYTTAPIASSLNLCGCSAKALHPSPSLLVIFCSHSSPAVRRDAETTAQPRPMDPSAHPPTNPHRPSISSPPQPRHRLSSHLSPSALIVFCSHSSPAVRRDAETTAQSRRMDPSAHPPTNPHRPSISSPPPPDIVSSHSPALPLTPPIRCSSPAPHLAPPCYPIYIYTSLDAKYVLFCVAYALVCAGRAVLYVHARRP